MVTTLTSGGWRSTSSMRKIIPVPARDVEPGQFIQEEYPMMGQRELVLQRFPAEFRLAAGSCRRTPARHG